MIPGVWIPLPTGPRDSGLDVHPSMHFFSSNDQFTRLCVYVTYVYRWDVYQGNISGFLSSSKQGIHTIMETHGNPIIDWQQNHAKKNHNNLQTFPPNPRRFDEHEPLQEHLISYINHSQSITLTIYISCIPLPVFRCFCWRSSNAKTTGKTMAKSHGVLRRPVPELNGLVGRSLGLASGCARRRVIYEETQIDMGKTRVKHG